MSNPINFHIYMKKLYSALAAILCLSLAGTAAPVKKSHLKIKKSDVTAVQAKAPAKHSKKIHTLAESDAKENVSIAGSYTWNFYDLFYGVAGDNDATIAEGPDGTVTVDGLLSDVAGFFSNEKLALDAVYNATDGTLSIAKQEIGYDDEYSETAYFCALDLVENPAYDPDDEMSEQYLLEEHDGPFVFTYTDGEFVADPDLVIGVIGMDAADGSYLALCENVLTPATNWITGWSDAGSVSYTDGWILPGLQDNPETYAAYEVAWQVNDENPNLVRMLNPFGNGSHAEADNMNDSKDGYIIFDISDPDCVLVLPNVYSGYEDLFYGSFYCYNFAGIFADMGFGTEEIKSQLEASSISTYKNGIITVPEPIFGITGERDGCYSWYEEGETPMAAIINIDGSGNSGVANVGVSAESTAAEYFTLQGIRVDRPTSGGLYIIRRGDSCTKVSVR